MYTNKMVAADSPVIMSKACEFFIKDLTNRAQFFCLNDNRKIIAVI